MICVEHKSGVNQKSREKQRCRTRKIDSNSVFRTQRVVSQEIEMSGQIFGRRATLIDEVSTCAHAPQERHKVY